MPPQPGDNDRLLSYVRDGNVADSRGLLNAGASPLAVDSRGRTGLHLAIELNNHTDGRELMAMFLNRGLSVDVRDAAGATALHYAMRDTTSYRAGYKIDDLLRFGADIEARDNEGRTPLHHAVLRANGDAAKYIMGHGANVNAADDKGYTVLHAAAAGGNATIIRELIQAGANLHAVTREGKTIWDAAVEAGQDYQAQWLKAEAQKAKLAEAEKIAARERAAQEQKLAEQNRAAEKPKDPWSLLDDSRVAFSRTERGIGYRLTEIFNFSSRTYTQITQNIATKAEAVVLRTFDEFTDKTVLEKAHDELERLGGKAEKAQITGPMVDKLRMIPRLPAPGK